MVGLMNPSSSTGGFSFGQPANTGTFPFGQTTGTSQQSGFSFGTSTAPANTATVNPLPQAGGFNFGSSTPNPTTGFGGISFGQTTTPSTSSTGLNFGVTPSQPTFSGGLFGSVVNPTASASSGLFGQTTNTATSASTGLNFGQTTSTASTGLNFGQTAGLSVASTGLSFGQTANASASPSTGLNFGQPANPTATASTGLNFGQTLNPPTSTGFSILGQTLSQPPTTGFALGQTSNPSTSATGLTFGQVSNPTSTGVTFGQTANPTSTAGLFGQTSTPASSASGLFGQTANPVASTGLNFNLAGNQAATTSTGLNFGLGSNQAPTSTGLFSTTSSIATPSTGLNFGLSTPSSIPSSSEFSLASTSGGLGGLTSSSTIFSSIPTSSTPSLGLGGSLPTSISTSGGLGGFQPPSVDSGNGSSVSKGDGKSAKEAPLPQDIFATIAVFESYKDTEKKASEENIRQTAAPFHKLGDDTKKLRQHIVKLSNQHAQLHASACKLKSAVIQEAENVEMARRTQETPMSLQGDNKSPEQFFLRLVRSFEERMTYCRNKIDEVEKCSRTNGGISEITSEDMKEVLKKEHEMVKMLAAKVYTLHNQLINYSHKFNNPEQLQPELLFKPASTGHEPIGISNKNSSILRPCLVEGGSGLLDFQNGQQRAKAVSLGAAPPTLPLTQTSMPNLLGSTNQTNSLFGGSTGFGQTPLSFGNNNTSSSFNFGNKTTLGSTTPLFGSFGQNQTVPQSQTNGSIFGSPGSTSTLFGTNKTFGKSVDHEESQRKRRM